MKNRVWYADILRIIAILLVVLLHTSSRDFERYAIGSFNWQILNLFDGFARICVPLFVMLSGMFMLNPERERPIRVLYQKNIFRMVKVFLFWSSFYAIFITLFPFTDIHITQKTLKTIWDAFYEGHFHLWFIFRIVELYVMTPFLKKIAEDKKTMLYLIAYCFVIGFLIPTLRRFPVASTTTIVEDWFNLDITFGYVAYYFLGYYLNKFELTKKVTHILYGLGIAGFLITIVGTSVLSMQRGKQVDLLYEYLTPNVFFAAIAFFVFFKQHIQHYQPKGDKQKIIALLSNRSFGVYLVHLLVLYILWKWGLTTEFLPTILSVPLITAGVFIISYYLITWLSKIPGLKKIIM
ncbi:acyltransferase [Pisciglobus halotolerans]|uniref:Surface polysaccharide O-acyltransferase, integral membrane enzyme n=1 Tax=Pisciglobus halotolerans TaxID=745365 RepID=A0A1I3CR32_9LACT|nr:acyltransferase family protein [Pisciglobus halotolerans]SFH76756.1 Surface polysaccharide O-acyltransferase, integral membrane enzyme [Pisciglobus halotolerans]